MLRILIVTIALLSLAIAHGEGRITTPRSLRIHPGDLRVVVGERATVPERRAAQLLSEEIKRRTGLDVPVGSDTGGRVSLVIGTAASSAAATHFQSALPTTGTPGQDGFRLETKPDAGGRIFVLGQSPSGVVAGVGKLLRTMRYGNGTLSIPGLAVTDTPALPVRGIYFATHFFNFYHVARLEEVDRVIEEFALWGGNSLSVWFDIHHFRSIHDPAAQAHLARLKHFEQTAHRVGMQFGLTFIANEAYDGSPAALRPKPGPGSYGVELCPSIPEGLALIGKWQGEVLDAFGPMDFIWAWPYDQGGCACDKCKPWGANGFIKASEQLSRLYRARNPQGKVWLSTWLLDDIAGDIGEYAGLFRYVREQKPTWFDGIIAGTHGDAIPRPLMERPEPQRYGLAWFPEISMWGMNPWGGYGANPLPELCTRLRDRLAGMTQGGWPYSEGIYEDLNKWLWCRYYWSPTATADEALGEYVSYYLAPSVRADGVKLMHLMEQTHPHNNWNARSLGHADEAWAIADSIDRRLPAWTKSTWRWRILYVRAAMDHILKTQGYRSPVAQAALKPLCDELVAIYQAQNTSIRPPAFPAARAAADDLALGCKVTASSTLPEYAGSEQALTDGILAEEDGEDFWVHDVRRERTAWVTVDLGKPVGVKQVRLQYRGIYGQFWFVPEHLSFSVSQDGTHFEEAGATQHVPKEGTEYLPQLWAYDIGKAGRYVRIELGPSQHTGDQYTGSLELVEVEVVGK